MKARWEDLATRARGLATHLLTRADVTALATAPDLTALGDALRARGFPLAEGTPTADALELAVRRDGSAKLWLLTRWAGVRNPLLAVILDDEDRRSIRALVRGAVQGAAADMRLAGLVPTPTLPERALAELAGQPTPRAVAALLTAWGNAFGPALLRATQATQPDLLEIEHGLNRSFADRALRGARAAGSQVLLDCIRETIDLENANAALVLAGAERDGAAKGAFVGGGRTLSLAAFLEAIADGAGAARRLAAAFHGSELAAVFERWGADPARIEEQLLMRRVARLRALARRDPAGPASVLEFALRLRAEVLDLQRVIWGVALGAPRGAIAEAAVTT
jgi:vacuolar-type H+-ATPase subunit C/Vma6